MSGVTGADSANGGPARDPDRPGDAGEADATGGADDADGGGTERAERKWARQYTSHSNNTWSHS
jgi:hypothetical protein